MGSHVSHFNVSLIMQGKVSVRESLFFFEEEEKGGPKRAGSRTRASSSA